jgi:hypothetical protein
MKHGAAVKCGYRPLVYSTLLFCSVRLLLCAYRYFITKSIRISAMKKKENEKQELNDLHKALHSFFGSVQKIQNENQKKKKNQKTKDGNAQNTK